MQPLLSAASLLPPARAADEAHFVAALPSVSYACRGCIATAFVLWSWAVVGLSAIRWQVRAIRRPSPAKSDCYTDATMSAEALHYNYPRVGGALDWQAPPCWPSRLLLALLVVCDRLLAVLCPMRPVRVLVDTAQKRDEREIPGLVHCEFFSMAF